MRAKHMHIIRDIPLKIMKETIILVHRINHKLETVTRIDCVGARCINKCSQFLIALLSLRE